MNPTPHILAHHTRRGQLFPAQSSAAVRIGCRLALTAALVLLAGGCADEDGGVRETTVEPGQVTVATVTVDGPPISNYPTIVPPTASAISRTPSTPGTVAPPTVVPTLAPTTTGVSDPSEPPADPNP
ncbi:hypothetical protein [Nocardia shimofusensis]|uniref:hypothetical protein n=1 Tax=Nocardia shimofusensis TaxID=228596 RepID=UPI000831B7E7|nr:hypothetical protein [Nocardia shimofusensis]